MNDYSGDVLLRIEPSHERAVADGVFSLSAAGARFELEPLFEVAGAPTRGAGVAEGQPVPIWHLARADRVSSESPWDTVHELRRQAESRSLRVTAAEPDLVHRWPTPQALTGIGYAGEQFRDQTNEGGKAVFKPGGEKVFAWHLLDEFSGLRSARKDARQHHTADIRVAHLDVGYNRKHKVFPAERFETLLSRNMSGDNRGSHDIDDCVRDRIGKNPGHGTATLALLAGGRYEFVRDGRVVWDDDIGATLDASVVGLRVGDSVVQFKTSSVARAIAYAAELCENDQTRVHVLSMSMGGVASGAWADAVNKAYLSGIVIVTAAGNNFSAGPLGGVPTTSTVYPARFDRVLAACGVMADSKPYFGLNATTMQGNWGPRSKRPTSLAAYTPNTPWVRAGDDEMVDMNGAGTSSATPQIAGTAALYLQKYGDRVLSPQQYPEPWMRVEVVRHALISSANKEFSNKALKKLGSGVLRADRALQVKPIEASQLKPSPEARARFAFWKALAGIGLAAEEQASGVLELELAQLVQKWPLEGGNPFDELLDKADASGGLNKKQKRELVERLRTHPDASAACRKFLQGQSGGGPKPGTAAPVFSRPVAFTPDPPQCRRLQGYALDPFFAGSLQTHRISETVFEVPWEGDLRPGPIDEYVEVIDVDPASNTAYEPVDLNHPTLLAGQGIAPSEGNPQFHQQMVYAVTRMTIANFERALGRPALWRPGPAPPGKNERDDSVYVPRLRVYPHALRQANAYYSPALVALLFGYFESSGGGGSGQQTVFTCLSQDIIAHETTHALLDGMHRQYLNDSNPDVLAFHEAFADIVSLFQRLTLSDLLRHEIAATRGDIRNRRSVLGQLATQFGRALGRRGGLREAIGGYVGDQWEANEPDGSEYERSFRPHARGRVLVAAVFDAFISIYQRRTEDLLRIASEGTGVLRPGALHPDLVARLAKEAAKSASHVLQMCIRALDYCPPTDLTFGEYLRAIVTADHEIVPDDDMGYRVAFVEAFRKRGIIVHDVRAVGVESLLWRSASDEGQGLSGKLCQELWKFRDAANAHGFSRDRAKIFAWQRAVRQDVHRELKLHFKDRDLGHADARVLGLDPAESFEVHTARFAMRVGPDGKLLSQVILGLLQRKELDELGGQIEGGATVIADLATKQVQYVIRKNIDSPQRRASARTHMAAKSSVNTYFDNDEPFAALHEHF